MDQSAALALKIAARSSSLHRRLLPAPFRNGIMGSSRKPSDLAEAFLSVGDSAGSLRRLFRTVFSSASASVAPDWIVLPRIYHTSEVPRLLRCPAH